MPKLFIIDDSWQEQQWINTGGTRAKMYLAAPNGNYYYFKESEKKSEQNGKPAKDYKYEFWSEIIAYELGRFLGFNVLRYDIAIYKDKIGCISEDMTGPNEDLIEGIRILQAYDDTFNPVDTQSRKCYTFQLIEKAATILDLPMWNTGFVENVLTICVFDAVIGNTDRHQENWGFIFNLREVITEPKDVYDIRKFLFAPIYDSGSCLGRELTDEKVLELITGEENIAKYISKGKSEIHWEGKKMSHFEFLQNVIQLKNYQAHIYKVIKNVVSLFDTTKVKQIIENIDGLIPANFSQYKIPNERKILMLKLITLRIKKLEELLDA